jgi:hypothetical protein
MVVEADIRLIVVCPRVDYPNIVRIRTSVSAGTMHARSFSSVVCVPLHPSLPPFTSLSHSLTPTQSVRQVELQQGNLVLDVQVPTHIIGSEKSEEMTKMRYTAATCDPDNFMSSKYSLRPYLYGRKTEIFVVMTMYNEDDVLFLRTMNA